MTPPNTAAHINTNPTPKARFIAHQAMANAHRNLMQDPNLQNSLDYALMEFQAQLAMQTLAPEGNFNACAAAHIKIQGVLQFIQVLKSLGERGQILSPVNRDNLEQV